MDWLSHSPDLNPIENFWGKLIRDVYVGGRQYNNQNAIVHAWNNIQQSYLEKLEDVLK
jgi:transposase